MLGFTRVFLTVPTERPKKNEANKIMEKFHFLYVFCVLCERHKERKGLVWSAFAENEEEKEEKEENLCFSLSVWIIFIKIL